MEINTKEIIPHNVLWKRNNVVDIEEMTEKAGKLIRFPQFIRSILAAINGKLSMKRLTV